MARRETTGKDFPVDKTGEVQRREQIIRAMFARARRSFPRWNHIALLRRVWPHRPRGTCGREMLRTAREFELD